MSNSLRPHGLLHARIPFPSPLCEKTPTVCSNSCPLSQWCHPIISSSVVPFSSFHQSFPASGSFPVSQLFASGDQNTGASALASVLSMIIQGWFPLGLTGLMLQSTGVDSQESSPAPQFKSINFSALSHLYGPTFIFIHNYGKNHSFDYMDLCRQNDVSAFLIHCLGLL